MTQETAVVPDTLDKCVRAPITNETAPQLDGVEVAPLHGGCHNRMFKIDCGQLFVARVAEPEGCGQLAQCFESLQHLRAYGLEDLGPRPILLRLPVLIMSFLDGQPYENFANLTPSEAEAFGQAVARLHRIRRSNPQGKTHQDFIQAMLGRTVTNRLAGYDASAYPELAEGASLLAAKIKTSGSKLAGTDESLLHRDLSSGNVIWKKGIPRFIDWASAFGDPAQELDYIMNNAGNDMGEAARKRFLQAYCQAGGDDDAFARLPFYQLSNALDDLAWAIERHHFAGQFPQRSIQDVAFYEDCIPPRKANLRTAIARMNS